MRIPELSELEIIPPVRRQSGFDLLRGMFYNLLRENPAGPKFHPAAGSTAVRE